ncbi:hypothetical protein T08_15380 [Trichinella sp. T8]|nr:hypothetical protein T08_15380 [Trichinella sp. T8]
MNFFKGSYDSMCMCVCDFARFFLLEWLNVVVVVVVVQTHKLFLYQSRSYLSVFMLCFAFDLKASVGKK